MADKEPTPDTHKAFIEPLLEAGRGFDQSLLRGRRHRDHCDRCAGWLLAYELVAGQPGTFFYRSHDHPARQQSGADGLKGIEEAHQ